MTVIEKIEELNIYCNNTLSICHYVTWELNSYKDGNIFSLEGKIGPIMGKNLEKLINYAYDLYKEETKK